MLIRGAACDDRSIDLRYADGHIVAVQDLASGPRLAPDEGEETLEGGRVTPPLAEPHVHLDAALLGRQAPNRSGTLREGIENWARLREQLTPQDVHDRALETVEMYLSYGTTRIRTHVDTGSRTAVEVLLGLKDDLRTRGVELQVVAFPQEGILTGRGRREAWERAVESGCDAVGAIPHLEPTHAQGSESVRLAFELAERHDRAVDFHCDETDDPGSRNLEVVCQQTADRGWAGRVIAGHCTAMHSYPNPYAAKVCALVAASGVQVVANPLDNVVLQGRYDTYPKRRGLTRIDELWEAGATIGIGHDSVLDPWYPLGVGNLLDAASMAIHVGHLTSVELMTRVFRTLVDDNHLAFGGPVPIAQGARTPVLWWPQSDPVEILRTRPRPTLVS